MASTGRRLTYSSSFYLSIRSIDCYLGLIPDYSMSFFFFCYFNIPSNPSKGMIFNKLPADRFWGALLFFLAKSILFFASSAISHSFIFPYKNITLFYPSLICSPYKMITSTIIHPVPTKDNFMIIGFLRLSYLVD